MEENKKIRKGYFIKQWVYMIVGCFLCAIASNLFFDKISLVTGGVTGIAIIIKHYYGLPLWITNAVINIPLFIIAVLVKGKQKGKELGIKTVIGIILYTFFLGITTWDISITEDILLIAVFGAIVSGMGIGLIFRAYGSTGGTDLLGIIVHKFMPQFSLGNILTVIESMIVICGAYVFGIHKSLYALIAVYVYTKVVDIILKGAENGSIIYIISDNYEEVSKALFAKIDRGITALKGEGMYSHKDKNVLMIVADKKQVPRIKNIVYEVDNNAFLFVSDASEVLGNGFLKKDEMV